MQCQLQALALHLGHELHQSGKDACQQGNKLHVIDEHGVLQHHDFPDVRGSFQLDRTVHAEQAVTRHSARDQHRQQEIPAELDPLFIKDGLQHFFFGF